MGEERVPSQRNQSFGELTHNKNVALEWSPVERNFDYLGIFLRVF